jgi:hypothetical protein
MKLKDEVEIFEPLYSYMQLPCQTFPVPPLAPHTGKLLGELATALLGVAPVFATPWSVPDDGHCSV